MHRLLTSLPFCFHQFTYRVCGRLTLPVRVAAIFAVVASIFIASEALAQPANDNFANAQVAVGASGSINGSNIGATKETGEPPTIAGNAGGASVWYTWTAPANMTVSFATVGSDFDTIMGVYTGNSITALTVVGENDDANGATVTSAVTFNAAGGTKYFIAVDGFDGATGNIILSWGANPSAGDFRFTTGLHLFSDYESEPTSFSGRMFPAGAYGPRIVVTRTGGAVGRTSVDYSFTNAMYTNYIFFTESDTNVFNSTVDTNGNTSFTNYLLTNIFAFYRYQDNEWGEWVYLPVDVVITNIGITNDNGIISGGIIFTNQGTNLPAPFICANFAITNMTTNGMFITNIVCTNYVVTNYVPTAVAGTDYLPATASGTLVFDDFQMSSDISIFILPTFDFGIPFGPPVVNRVLIGTLTNALLDPLESSTIAPPTTATSLANTLVNILNQDEAGPDQHLISSGPGPGTQFTCQGFPGTNVFNFTTAAITCKEDVNGFGVAQVRVHLSSIGPLNGASVDYRIDHYDHNNGETDNANNLFRRVGPSHIAPYGAEIPLQAGSDYATPPDPFYFSPQWGVTNPTTGTVSPGEPDFFGTPAIPLTGTLTWPANDPTDKTISITISNDTRVEFNEDLLVQLYFNGSPPANLPAQTDRALGNIQTCVVTILFDDQPAGAVDRNYNPDGNSDTDPPFNPHPGANGTVFSTAVQADFKTILAGNFTGYNTNPRNRIARANADGSNDPTFNPPGGADDVINSILIDSIGRILAGGAFTSINGVGRKGIARLNGNGTLDTTFNPGLGANGPVSCLALQPDGNLLIGGEFTFVNGTNRNYVARLGTNGVLDASFDTSTGPNGQVSAIALQPDGRVLIGGEFTAIGGVPRNHIARLNADGSLDTTFDPGVGANDVVYAIAVESDGTILIGGAFTLVRDSSRPALARLNTDGSLDLSFDPGTGANGTIYTIVLENQNGILIGGRFNTYNQTRRVGIARLYNNGLLDTTFMDTAYNQLAGIPNRYYNPTVEPPNFIYSISLAPTNDLMGGLTNIMIGGSFDRVGGGFLRDDIRNRNNFARLVGGGTPGPGNIYLDRNSYTVDENGGDLFVRMIRTNGFLGPAGVTISANILPPGPGAASTNDITFPATTPIWVHTGPPPPNAPFNQTWEISNGTFGQNNGFGNGVDGLYSFPDNDVTIGINDNTIIDGNRQFNLALNDPRSTSLFYSGTPRGYFLGQSPGQEIPAGVALGNAAATVTIVDNDTAVGTVGFSQSNFPIGETNGVVNITVTRTNGSGAFDVNYATSDGTAIAPGDYKATSGSVHFGQTDTSAQFQVKIVDDTISEDDETFNVRLFNPTSGASLGVSNAVVTIIDNDSPNGRVNFSSPTYATNENSTAAIVTVNRSGGSQGTLDVYFATSDGTAVSGVDYYGTNYLLHWDSGQFVPTNIVILINNDQLVNGNRTVNLRVRSPLVNGITNNTVLGSTSNAVLTIIDDDAYGTLAFTRSVYNVNENGGPAIVTVQRTAGIAQSVTVNFAAVGGTASPGFDYTPTNGVMAFAPGEISKSFAVPIIDNLFKDGNRFIGLILSNATPAGSLGFPQTAQLNIIDDETFNEPAGSPDTTLDQNAGFNGDVFALALQTNGMILVAGDFTQANNLVRNRLARLNPDGSIDTTFSTPTTGANAVVRSLIVQADGRILIGGFFTNVNGVINNHIARLNYNGTLDSLFNPGAGADNNVFTLAETFVDDGTRRLFVGGAFLNFKTVPRSCITRLMDDGSVDTSWDPGIGANGPVFAVVPYPTNSVRKGQVLIGGDFTSVGGLGRAHIARLNADGSVDTTFTPPSGTDDSVRAIALQTDEHILIGGLFTNVNGVASSHIGRLNPNGTTDTSFTPGPGVNDAVLAITLQADNKILLGGQFAFANGVTRHRITRMNTDGTVDPTINFGLGADSFVGSLVVQPDDKILVGGGFTHYDGAPYSRFVRIYGRSMNGSGTLEFDSAQYSVLENGTNAVVTVRRRGGTAGFPTPNANVFVTMSTSNGTAIAGVNYTAVVTNLAFPIGEVVASVGIPITDDFLVNPDRTVFLHLSNPQPTGGPALGNQAGAVLTIINDDCAVSFSSSTYSVNEDTGLGAAVINFVRTGSTNNPATVDFVTTTNGTAIPGVNYLPVSNTVSFVAGQTSAIWPVPVFHDLSAQGDRTVTMILTNPQSSVLVAPAQATLTIVDVETAPGQFNFAATNFYVAENAGDAVVTVLRTNGHSGVVQVNFATSDGAAAFAGIDYVSTNGVLTFADGVTVAQFKVHIIDNNIVQNPRSLNITLSNPTGGTTIGSPPTVPLTILDNDVGITFASPTFTVNEGNGTATISVLRLNGSNGVATVNYSTTNSLATNGLAVAGIDYLATSGILTFNNGETFKTFTIPIIDNTIVDGDRTFGVTISNVQPPSAAQLVTKFATVTILDNDVGFFFTNSVLSVSESSNLLVTVVRTNGSPTGTNSVVYSTSDGTGTAGFDYTATSGVLTFTNGETVKTFVVPILQNTAVGSDKTFNISLANPVGGQLLSPSNTVVTIINNNSGFSFSNPTYSVNEGGVRATITVIRSGVLTNSDSVDFSTTNGTGSGWALAGVRYFPTNGTLVFTNGETSHVFTVQVIDDTIIEGDQVVALHLSNPTGHAALLTPSDAFLTIVDNDGSLIAAAGAALIGESGPVNGAIDTNETVTLLFALRNSVGEPTTNLVATLLATNGVTLPTGPQNYGVLVPGGPSASRQFSFKASGTNGSPLVATLQLQDGPINLGIAVFNFTLGTNYYRFTNSAFINIRDDTNALPYPSTINVSGLNGVVAKATVTLTNFSHTHPNDVDIVLAAPGGQNMLILANNGGANAINNVMLTLDDAGSTGVPNNGTIVTGTNYPSPVLPVAAFPSPAPPAPYATNLTACNGSNPNGAWNLFVIDDTTLDTGSIASGWILTLTTASVVPGASDLVLGVTDTPDPDVIGSNVTYTISVTNFGPSTATNVIVSANLPNTANFISASAGYALSNNVVTFANIGNLAKDAAVTLNVVVQPFAVGPMTNIVTVSALDADPNLADNTVASVTTVVPPSADLSLTLSDAPDPVVIGSSLVYTLTVSNAGPATATTVKLTNTLPAGVSFVSASPPGYILSGNNVIYTGLGNLGSGSVITATITVNPTAVGEITDTATVSSTVTDPLKANNTVSAKTIVEGLQLTVARSGNNVSISWPASAANYVLESANTLVSPVTWSTVTTPPAVLVGDQKVVTVGATNDGRFFRLRAGP
jgi:uncharacterized repeat protein (TIGR01451 family)/uncharacterized delta-60 repeat protein